MKRRQEGGEEKKMGTEERERRRSRRESRGARKKEEKKRGEERYRREGGRRKENKECGTKDAHPPLPDAFPSQRLGNNMTPIKGELGKNTTPTKRDLEKLIQRRQRNPIEDSRTLSIHLLQTSSTYCGKQNLRKRKTQRQQNPHL